MKEENIKTVQVIYVAFGRGDVARILDELTDDVDWAPEAHTGAVPWHRGYVGKDDVPESFPAGYRRHRADPADPHRLTIVSPDRHLAGLGAEHLARREGLEPSAR